MDLGVSVILIFIHTVTALQTNGFNRYPDKKGKKTLIPVWFRKWKCVIAALHTSDLAFSKTIFYETDYFAYVDNRQALQNQEPADNRKHWQGQT